MIAERFARQSWKGVEAWPGKGIWAEGRVKVKVRVKENAATSGGAASISWIGDRRLFGIENIGERLPERQEVTSGVDAVVASAGSGEADDAGSGPNVRQGCCDVRRR